MARELTLITDSQIEVFLTAYRKTGLMQQSAKLAGLSKHDIDKYAAGKTAASENFALNLQDAAETWSDVIRSEITRRAIEGIDRDIYFKGRWIATEKVFSDPLLSKMAEATLPEYKKTADIQPPAISIHINTFQPDAPALVVDTTATYISDLE